MSLSVHNHRLPKRAPGERLTVLRSQPELKHHYWPSLAARARKHRVLQTLGECMEGFKGGWKG